jgi:hypothetical protein
MMYPQGTPAEAIGQQINEALTLCEIAKQTSDDLSSFDDDKDFVKKTMQLDCILKVLAQKLTDASNELHTHFPPKMVSFEEDSIDEEFARALNGM